MQENNKGLTFTGERYLPTIKGDIWCEHWHRYLFAQRLVAGLTVLDAASGEGYGASLLAQTAQSVIGVDISPQAATHASKQYATQTNLQFKQGSVTALPLADASVDCVVSFETIEHLHEQREMLAEFARVLKPTGLLILSSPDREEYSSKRDYANEFHVKELSRAELDALLAPHFPSRVWYGQRMTVQSAIWGISNDEPKRLAIDKVDNKAAMPAPMYWLVLASREQLMQPKLATLHLLADPDDQLIGSFYESEKKRVHVETLLSQREQLIVKRDAEVSSYAQTQASLAATVASHSRLIAERDDWLKVTNTRVNALEQQLAEHRLALSNKDSELQALETARLGLLSEAVTAQHYINDQGQTIDQLKAQREAQQQENVRLFEHLTQTQGQLSAVNDRLQYRQTWRGWLALLRDKALRRV
jgi:SAM-dependent methyltransferase